MLKWDSFVFSGAQGTQIISFPCIASTNCHTVYSRIKQLAGYIWQAVSYSFEPQPTSHQHCKSQLLRQIRTGATGFQKELLPLHPGQRWPAVSARFQTAADTRQESQEEHRTCTEHLPRYFSSPFKHFYLYAFTLGHYSESPFPGKEKKKEVFLQPVVVYSYHIA